MTNVLLIFVWTASASTNVTAEVLMASGEAGAGWRQGARVVAVGQGCGNGEMTASVRREDLGLTNGTVWFGAVALAGERESEPSNLVPATWARVTVETAPTATGPWREAREWTELAATNRFWRVRGER